MNCAVQCVLVPSNGMARELFGADETTVRLVEKAFPVRLTIRGNEVHINGADHGVVQTVADLFRRLVEMQGRGARITEADVRYAVRMARNGTLPPLEAVLDVVVTTHQGKQVRTKTAGQKAYVDAIRKHGITFGIGPAGTGKTYLAIGTAVAAFKNKEVSRIVLTRPAVEAGEKLGFLPGDMQQKVDPFLRPLYDALFDMLGKESFERYMERGQIEVVPLAFMRGRTLENSFIILDEAQNTTPEQMKMFLTRMGFGSKMVVTGDPTQVDLPAGMRSGLVDAISVLEGVEGVAFCYLTEADVVRHDLVQRIILAYEKARRKGG